MIWDADENNIRWLVKDKWIIRWSDQSPWKGLLGVCHEFFKPNSGYGTDSVMCPKNWVVA